VLNPKVAQFIKPAESPMSQSHRQAPELGSYQPQRKVAVAGGGSFPLLDDDILSIPAFLRNQAD